MRIPDDIMYNKDIFPSFSSEELEKLRTTKPSTLHAASQIQGITPHALIYLHSYISRGRHNQNRASRAARVAATSGSGSGATAVLETTTTTTTTTTTLTEDDEGDVSPMHPDFSVSPQEAELRKHYQEIDDIQLDSGGSGTGDGGVVRPKQ